MAHRLVVALFGPPGAGKTTIALASPLVVFDRDDERWRSGGEAAFRRAIRLLAGDAEAQAVVIRSGATSSARERALSDVGATHGFLVLTPAVVCHERVARRGREDARTSQAAIGRWWDRFEHDDGMPEWPGGWAGALAVPPLPVRPRREPARVFRGDRGYGPGHQRMREALRPTVAAGRAFCARCGKPIRPGEPWDLGHTDDRSAWTGPEHRYCNRSAGARRSNVVQREARGRRAHVDPPPPPGW